MTHRGVMGRIKEGSKTTLPREGFNLNLSVVRGQVLRESMNANKLLFSLKADFSGQKANFFGPKSQLFN
jgi:hypothetical protein